MLHDLLCHLTSFTSSRRGSNDQSVGDLGITLSHLIFSLIRVVREEILCTLFNWRLQLSHSHTPPETNTVVISRGRGWGLCIKVTEIGNYIFWLFRVGLPSPQSVSRHGPFEVHGRLTVWLICLVQYVFLRSLLCPKVFLRPPHTRTTPSIILFRRIKTNFELGPNSFLL